MSADLDEDKEDKLTNLDHAKPESKTKTATTKKEKPEFKPKIKTSKKTTKTHLAKFLRNLLKDSELSDIVILKILENEADYILRNHAPQNNLQLLTLANPTKWQCVEGKLYREEQPDGSYILWQCSNGQMKLVGPA